MTKTQTAKANLEDLEGEISDLEGKMSELDDKIGDLLASDGPEEKLKGLEDEKAGLKAKLADLRERKDLLEAKLPEVEKQTFKAKLAQCKGQAKDQKDKANELRDLYIEKQREALEAGRKWRSVVDEATNLEGKCQFLAAKADVSGPKIPTPKQVDDNPEVSLDNWFTDLRKITGEVWGKSSWDKKIQRLRRKK